MLIIATILIIVGIVKDSFILWPAIGFAIVGLVKNLTPDKDGKRFRYW